MLELKKAGLYIANGKNVSVLVKVTGTAPMLDIVSGILLNDMEKESPVFFGIDGTDVGLQAVLDSDMRGTVYNDKEGQAEAMVRLAAAIATGEGMQEIDFEKERCIYLSHWKITRENVEDYIKDGGDGTGE